MNVKQALLAARKFIIYGTPYGDSGSFEPLKATYDDNKEAWEVVCQFTRNNKLRTAKVEIDANSEEIIGFERVT